MSSVPFHHLDGMSPISILQTVGQDAYNTVMKPFTHEAVLNELSAEDTKNEKIKAGLEYLKNMGKKYNANSSLLHEEYEKAKSILYTDLTDTGEVNLEGYFSDAFESYSTLISTAMTTTLAGVDDISFYQCNSAPDSYPDLRAPDDYYDLTNKDNFYYEMGLTEETDISGLYSDSTCDEMATSFALADTFIKNSSTDLPLTNSLLLNMGQLSGLQNDTHDYGAIGHIIGFSKYYQALISCLDSFITNIGSDKFNDTLIHISSEFNRCPKYNALGSDHGGDGSNVTLISGRITEPILLNEIKSDDSSIYTGEWGHCGSEYFEPKDIHNVITKIMGGEVYFARDNPLEDKINVDSAGLVTSDYNLFGSESTLFSKLNPSRVKTKKS